MANKDELYWIAPGVVQVDGKDYGIDTALPVGKIEKDLLDKWKKQGKVGAKIAAVSSDISAKLKEANDKIKELESDLAEANETIAGFEKELADLNELMKDEGK